MRITIDLEPSEVQAATDLIAALRALTDQVQVRTQSAATLPAPASNPAPVPAAPTGPFIPAQAASGTAAPPPPAGPATSATATPAVPTDATKPKSPFQAVLQTLNSDERIDSVAGQLTTLLQSGKGHTSEELVESFEVAVFVTSAPGTGLDLARVERYFQLLAHKLPDPFNTDVRRGVLQRVLRVLTRAREVECDRLEVMPYAVGFAVLARLECVKMSGALQTICKLLKPSNVCAAITMLGQLLSKCGTQVLLCPELDKVWSALAALPEAQKPSFQPDREYFDKWRSYVQAYGEPPQQLVYAPVRELRGAAGAGGGGGGGAGASSTSGAAAPALQNGSWGGAGAAAPPAQALMLSSCMMVDLRSQGVCVAWDATTRSALVVGSDSTLTAWQVTPDAHAHLASKIDLPNAPVSYHVSTRAGRGQVLVAANPAPGQQQGHYLALHDTSTGLPRRTAVLPRAGCRVSSVLLLATDTDRAVSAETWSNGSSSVSLWDMPRMAAPGLLENPLHMWQDAHTAPVTCSAVCEADPWAFATGAEDGTVQVWDARVQNPTLFVTSRDTGGKAHTGSVVTMDLQGTLLLTAGADKTVRLWDLRHLHTNAGPILNMAVENHGVPIYKVAYGSSPSNHVAALATGSGLYLLDWSSPNNPTMTPTPGYHVASGAFPHTDICWAPNTAPGGGLGLLGVCGQNALTLFSVQSAAV